MLSNLWRNFLPILKWALHDPSFIIVLGALAFVPRFVSTNVLPTSEFGSAETENDHASDEKEPR